MVPLLATFTFVFLQRIIAQDVIIGNKNITCAGSDDCIINCPDCTDHKIYCQSGYSCTINCIECSGISVYAYNVPSITFNCSYNCYRAIIDVTLSSIDSQFKLECVDLNISRYAQGCNSLDATVAHIEDIYVSKSLTSTKIDYTVDLLCEGDGFCQSAYINGIVNGKFYAKCIGTDACSFSNIAYNPPRFIPISRSQLVLECLGTIGSVIQQNTDPPCYRMNAMSPSTRQIFVKCGDGDEYMDNVAGSCRSLNIFGPVYPFDYVGSHSFSNIHSNSVYLECNIDQCREISIAVPFGEFQIESVNVVEQNSYDVYRTDCGWDFPSGGWDSPRRDDIDCDDQNSVDEMVMVLLKEGVDIVITNPYMFDLTKEYNEYICDTSKHCIIYSMDKLLKNEYFYYEIPLSAFNNFTSLRRTKIECPKDAVSYCYVFAVQRAGLSGSIINGNQTKLLLVKGMDKGTNGEMTFAYSTIYGPDKQYVEDGILLLAAGNAETSLFGATIYSENSAMALIMQVNSGMKEATFYVGDSDWIEFQCNYHSMCQDSTIFVNLQPESERYPFDLYPIMPDNLCVSCGDFYSGCSGMTLYINDTVQQIIYTLYSGVEGTGDEKKWYWIYDGMNGTDDTMRIPMPDEYGCSHYTDESLGESWYNGLDIKKNVYWRGIYEEPPEECDWVRPIGPYAPPLDGYCYTINDYSDMGSWTAKCESNDLIFKHYKETTDCSGNGVDYTSETIPSNCSFANTHHSCQYGSYAFKIYDTAFEDDECRENRTIGFIGYTRNVVFTSNASGDWWERSCFDNVAYSCIDINGTLTLQMHYYEDDDECHHRDKEPYKIVNYGLGTCVDNIYVENIECYKPPTTTDSSDQDNADYVVIQNSPNYFVFVFIMLLCCICAV